MPEYFMTAEGPKEIPAKVISEGRAACAAFVASQGWQPPPPAPPAAQPEPEPVEETE